MQRFRLNCTRGNTLFTKKSNPFFFIKTNFFAMNNETNWHCKFFTELSVTELYDILQLRSEVYVVEQQCIFLDMDGIDKITYHLFGYEQKQLVACCRLIAPDVVYKNKASIGRVVNSASVRGKGIGKKMISLAIEKCREFFPSSPIKIGAQLYLKEWYGSFGFAPCGEVYLEDGIEHIHMELTTLPSEKLTF